MIITDICSRQTVSLFLVNELDVDQKLDFLIHVEECKQCWKDIYDARKKEHPHYYQRTSRRVKVTEKELAKLNGNSIETVEKEESYQMV